MPTDAQIYDSFSSLSQGALEKVYLPGIYDIAFKRRNSYLVPKLTKSTEGVKGLEVTLDFIKEYGWSFRPMSELGYTPTGSPAEFAEQKAKLKGHSCALNVTQEAILATDGDQSRIGDLLGRLMNGMYQTLPEYMRSIMWIGSSGVAGVVGAVTGTVITLSNTGLNHLSTKDRAKYFVEGMYVQFLSSAAVKRGNPVKVTAVGLTDGKITVASVPDGVVATDLIVISDIAGLENTYNSCSPGIMDVIDDDNTFQGIDRSLATNAKFRAVVNGNSGTGRKPTLTLLSKFFHDCSNPDIAVTNFDNVDWIYQTYFSDKIRYVPNGSFIDGYNFVQIGKTKLVDDDDVPSSRIIVPDFANMEVRDKGDIASLTKGWQPVAGRPFFENVFVYYYLLIAKDCRYMGSLNDVDITAAS